MSIVEDFQVRAYKRSITDQFLSGFTKKFTSYIGRRNIHKMSGYNLLSMNEYSLIDVI